MANSKFITKSFFITLTLLITMTTNSISKNLNLMPYPKSVEILEGEFRLNEKFSVHFNIEGERIKNASNRFLNHISRRTGLFLDNPFSTHFNNQDGPGLKIFIDKEGMVKLGVDESYSIDISDSIIIVKATNDIGALRALETIQQLLTSDSKGYYFPKLKIEDSPRFPWRGLLIDVCRHFMPIEVLKRNIDGMAAVKLNVLHWHLSEDQGFRVESKTYPKLTALGSDGLFYTHEQVNEIIKYADDRGIRVVPEFDVPGHATAILTAYPELASAPGPYKIERGWGVFDPTLNPIKDETYIFLRNLFAEMTELFPDEYFHIGGDENNGKQWNENEEIQKFMIENNIEDNHSLQGYFNNKLLSILTNLDKKMIGWDEIFHPTMPTKIVIQSWRGKEALIESAKKGYQTILSNGYYIDLMQPTDFHYLNDPIAKDAELTEDEKKMILGGEATMWAELISTENIDSRIWPRTAAIAERLWSPQEINDVKDMYERLDNISDLLEEYGLTHIKNYELMLRRLSNNKETKSLHNLISVIEPVKIYKRHNYKKLTQQSPLTRVVDAAKADAKVAREFRQTVNDYLLTRNSKALGKIVEDLELWKKNHEQLSIVMKSSPILQEIKPMSLNLKNISQLGLTIIDNIKNKNVADTVWVNQASLLIDKSKEPVAETELMIVEGIENLFNSIK